MTRKRRLTALWLHLHMLKLHHNVVGSELVQAIAIPEAKLLCRHIYVDPSSRSCYGSRDRNPVHYQQETQI
ncbi:hypothetical protein M758_9G048800 [Ceratodon purpureus]|nr:hypothetical protein M758_9G048800 [Ceratodon purpureus]